MHNLYRIMVGFGYLVTLGTLWGGFVWFERHVGRKTDWQYNLFVWSLVVAITLNTLVLTYHSTRHHMYMDHPGEP